MKNPPATLRPFEDAQLAELMGWFSDRVSLQTWGGHEFRFPFTAQTFREDAKLGSLPTWTLVRDRALVAFGQYYLRAGRCHLGRLAVAPDCRGQGLGSTLVNALCTRGRAELGVPGCSLFVVPENTRASALYDRLGFKPAPYPEPMPGDDRYIYMVTDP